MGGRLNPNQRRQIDRRLNRATGGAFILTALFFALGAFLVHTSFMDSVYQQVLASGGRLTVDGVQAGYVINLIIPFLVVWIILAVIAYYVEGEKHGSFEFGESAPVQSTVRRARQIQFHKLNPRQFEEVVARMIATQGYQTKVVGGAGDGGVDVKVFSAQGRLVGVVQCKRYKPNKALTPAFVREMATVRQMHGVSIAYLATTAYFTEETKALARQLNVRLIDGDDLKHIAHKSIPQPQPVEDFDRSINGMWAESSPPPSPRNDPHQAFRRPMTEQERVQEQLDQRRRRMNLPKP